MNSKTGNPITTTPVGSIWRHVKTGGVYAVVGHCVIESTNAWGIIYAKPNDYLPWVRDADEFLDGRFCRIRLDGFYPPNTPAPQPHSAQTADADLAGDARHDRED